MPRTEKITSAPQQFTLIPDDRLRRIEDQLAALTQNMRPAPEFMTIAEVMEKGKFSRSTVYRMFAAGILHPQRNKQTRGVRILKTEFEKVVQAQ